MRFTDRIIELHRALETAALPHAFGGAIALAYCTLDPRGTDDIDINIFVGTRRLDDVIGALPTDIEVTDTGRRQLLTDGQARLFWHQTPIDVFLANHPFHGRAELQVRSQPFEGGSIPVLACIDLAVFKTFFARGKDAVDIAEMVKAGCVAIAELERTVRGLIGREREQFLTDVRRFSTED